MLRLWVNVGGKVSLSHFGFIFPGLLGGFHVERAKQFLESLPSLIMSIVILEGATWLFLAIIHPLNG